MKFEIKIPAVGESITEATISQWMKKNGDAVKRDDVLLILETDKASVEVVAEQDGKLSIKTQEGQTVAIGTVVGDIDSEAAGASAPTKSALSQSNSAPSAQPNPASPSPKSVGSPTPAIRQSQGPLNHGPAVNRIAAEKGLNLEGQTGSGKSGRLTKGDALNMSPSPASTSQATTSPTKTFAPTPLPQPKMARGEATSTREPMTKLRQTIARRLVEAQQTAAILTTFNEIDMSHVMALRSKYKDRFKEKHNVNLGFMGFFVKAAIEALKAFPRVNGFIDGTDIVFNHFYNVGIAVGTEKGLVVPVVRDADLLTIAEVEKSIKHYAEKARDGKISLDDLTGGTFTISNGGVYGSLMSTPILNPPQSAILGLHKIEERPVAIQGKVEIRPMMYVALSYDHRIIDGSESVSFLVKIKEGLEDPARLLLDI